MRDIKLITTDENLIDINILNGDTELLVEYEQSDGQRAALAATIGKGTIPGMLDVGVRWSDYFSSKSTDGYVSIDNQMRNMITMYGKSQYVSNSPVAYTPVAILSPSGDITTTIIRS